MEKKIKPEQVESLIVWIRKTCPKCGRDRKVMGSMEISRRPPKVRSNEDGWTITVPWDAKIETLSPDVDRGCGPCLQEEFNRERRKKNAKPNLRLVN